MVGGDQADLVRLAEDLTFCKKNIEINLSRFLVGNIYWYFYLTRSFRNRSRVRCSSRWWRRWPSAWDWRRKENESIFFGLFWETERCFRIFFHTGNPSCAGLAARARSCSRRRSGGTLLFPAREKGKRFFVSISNCFDVSCHSGKACADFPCRHQFVSLFTCSLIRESSSS